MTVPRFTLSYQVEHLPLFVRLYRGAFRRGSDVSTLRRAVNRVLYYTYDALKLPVSPGRFRLRVRDKEKVISFNARNRQFFALYFDQYADGYEPAVAAVVTQLVPSSGVFYDVGSNWGYFSLLVAVDPGFGGRVHAFEPWPSSHEDLSDVVRQAGLGEVITCHSVALGDSTATTRMTSGRHSGLAHVDAAGAGRAVSQQTLDTLDIDPPDLIKIDAEGMELAILKGGRQTLFKHRPMLVFEHTCVAGQPGSLDLLEFIEGLDYRLFVPLVQWEQENGQRRFVSHAHHRPPSGYLRTGLKLQPLTSGTRHAFAEYLNLFACHASRLKTIESYVAATD